MKSLGQKIVLHTDNAGKDLLDCLPYDEIYLTLNDNKAPIVFWASGKFRAMLAEPFDSVHIDTDFWIKSKEILSIVQNNQIVFPHSEKTERYQDAVKIVSEILTKANALHPIKPDDKNSVNMGLVKLGNETLRKTFIYHYWRLMFALSKDRQYMAGLSKPVSGVINSPDLVIEQLLMTKLIEQTKTLPAFLIDESELDYSAPKEIGFCHLLAFDKYMNSRKVLARLKQIDKQIYSAVINRYNEMNFKILNIDA
jgi:hypothetical protein